MAAKFHGQHAKEAGVINPKAEVDISFNKAVNFFKAASPFIIEDKDWFKDKESGCIILMTYNAGLVSYFLQTLL